MKNIIRSLFFGLFLIFIATSLNAQTEIKKNIWVDSTLTGKGTFSVPLSVNGDSIESSKTHLSYVVLFKSTGVGTFDNIVILNELSGPVVWTYDGVGEYTGTLTNAFTLNKSFAKLTPDFYNSNAFTANGGFNSDDEFHLNVRGNNAASTNAGWVFVEINVYN